MNAPLGNCGRGIVGRIPACEMVARGGGGNGRLGNEAVLRQVLRGGLTIDFETDFVENGTLIYWVSHKMQRVGYGFLDTLLADEIIFIRDFLKAFLSAVAVLDCLRNGYAYNRFSIDRAEDAFVPRHRSNIDTHTERKMQAIAGNTIGVLSQFCGACVLNGCTRRNDKVNACIVAFLVGYHSNFPPAFFVNRSARGGLGIRPRELPTNTNMLVGAILTNVLNHPIHVWLKTFVISGQGRSLLNHNDIPRLTLEKRSQRPLLVFQSQQLASHIMYIRKGRVGRVHIIPIFQRSTRIYRCIKNKIIPRNSRIHNHLWQDEIGIYGKAVAYTENTQRGIARRVISLGQQKSRI